MPAPKIIDRYMTATGREMVVLDEGLGEQPVHVPAQEAGIVSDLPLRDITSQPAPLPPPAATVKPPVYEQLNEEVDKSNIVPPSTPAPLTPPAPDRGEESRTTDVSMSPGLLKERELASKAMDLAQKRASNALDAERHNAESEAIARASIIERQAADEQARQDDVNQRRQEQMNKYNDTAEKYANTSIDSNRYWKNASTSDKIMAGVGLLAGAIANVRGVTDKNYGAEFIDKVIERDIREQETNLNKLGKQVDQQRTLYQDLRMEGLDAEAAASKMREMAYRALEAKLSGMAASSKNELAKANLEMKSAEYKQQAVNEAAKYNNRTVETVNRAIVAKPATQLSDKAVTEVTQDVSDIRSLHRLEDVINTLAESKKIGGRWNDAVMKAKDFLGVQDDELTQEAWKGYLTRLMTERSKVFGASLTKAEEEAFNRATTAWHSKPALLQKAVKDIRSKTEQLHKDRMGIYGSANYDVFPTIPLRVDQEAAEKRTPMKKAPTFK